MYNNDVLLSIYGVIFGTIISFNISTKHQSNPTLLKTWNVYDTCTMYVYGRFIQTITNTIKLFIE